MIKFSVRMEKLQNFSLEKGGHMNLTLEMLYACRDETAQKWAVDFNRDLPPELEYWRDYYWSELQYYDALAAELLRCGIVHPIRVDAEHEKPACIVRNTLKEMVQVPFSSPSRMELDLACMSGETVFPGVNEYRGNVLACPDLNKLCPDVKWDMWGKEHCSTIESRVVLGELCKLSVAVNAFHRMHNAGILKNLSIQAHTALRRAIQDRIEHILQTVGLLQFTTSSVRYSACALSIVMCDEKLSHEARWTAFMLAAANINAKRSNCLTAVVVREADLHIINELEHVQYVYENFLFLVRS